MTTATYSVTIKTLGGNTYTFADETEKNGSAAYAQLMARQDIIVNKTFIPYHAIDSATWTMTTATATAPADAFCGEAEEDPEP